MVLNKSIGHTSTSKRKIQEIYYDKALFGDKVQIYKFESKKYNIFDSQPSNSIAIIQARCMKSNVFLS